MDVFNQNWTLRIKTDPLVNTFLNYDKRKITIKEKKQEIIEETEEERAERIKEMREQPMIGDGAVTTTLKKDKLEIDDEEQEKENNNDKPKKPVIVPPLPVFVRNNKTILSSDRPIFPNTRPNSLYNLRYSKRIL